MPDENRLLLKIVASEAGLLPLALIASEALKGLFFWAALWGGDAVNAILSNFCDS